MIGVVVEFQQHPFEALIMRFPSNNQKQIPQSEMVFGIHALIEAFESGRELNKILIQRGERSELSKKLSQIARERSVPLQIVPVEKLNGITRKNHQGAIGFVSPITYYKIEQILQTLFEEGKDPFIMVVDRVTDIRNIGAIARSIACAGGHAMVIPVNDSAPINADAIKTSAGALHSLPVCRENLRHAIQYMKDSGLKVVAANEKSAKNIYQADLTGPLCIVMGSEDEGISEDLLSLVTESLKIPMPGVISSLNVSVASGIFLFEAIRQRI